MWGVSKAETQRSQRNSALNPWNNAYYVTFSTSTRSLFEPVVVPSQWCSSCLAPTPTASFEISAANLFQYTTRNAIKAEESTVALRFPLCGQCHAYRKILDEDDFSEYTRQHNLSLNGSQGKELKEQLWKEAVENYKGCNLRGKECKSRKEFVESAFVVAFGNHKYGELFCETNAGAWQIKDVKKYKEGFIEGR